MRIRLNEEEMLPGFVWVVEVEEVNDHPSSVVDELFAAELLDCFDEALPWERIRLFRILTFVDRSSDEQVSTWEGEGGPTLEVYDFKKDDVLVVIDGKYMSVNDFTVNVVLE